MTAKVPAVSVARLSDGSMVYSVVVGGTGGLDHEYWVVRDDEVLVKCPTLAAVDTWRAARS